MIIRVDGNEYVTKDTQEISAHEMQSQIYNLMQSDGMGALMVELEDGGCLVIPKEMTNRSVIICRDNTQDTD